jgi:hypothetical protein
MFKPILRPLSDLTKEIEVNGERFVPIIKIVDPDNDHNDWIKMKVEIYNPFPKMDMHHKYYRVIHNELGDIISINPKNITALSFFMVDKLLEWHFDIFNLIPNNLALDINTLK